MYRTNTKSHEHDATSVDLSSCSANMREDMISATTCCLTYVDINKICLLIVSLDDTSGIFFTLASPKSNFNTSSYYTCFYKGFSYGWYGTFFSATCNATLKKLSGLQCSVLKNIH